MPSLSATYRNPLAGRDLLFIAASCFGALALFGWSFGQWAGSEFAEPWALAHPVIEVMAPFAAIAFSSGLVVGVLTAALAPIKAVHIAAWAAVLACALSVGAAVVAGGLAWAFGEPTVLLGLFLGAGLICGAFLLRKVRHA